MAAHLVPLQEERAAPVLGIQVLLDPAVVEGESILAAQVAQAAQVQFGLKPQIVLPLDRAVAVAARVIKEIPVLPVLMAQAEAAV